MPSTPSRYDIFTRAEGRNASKTKRSIRLNPKRCILLLYTTGGDSPCTTTTTRLKTASPKGTLPLLAERDDHIHTTQQKHTSRSDSRHKRRHRDQHATKRLRLTENQGGALTCHRKRWKCSPSYAAGVEPEKRRYTHVQIRSCLAVEHYVLYTMRYASENIQAAEATRGIR